VATRDRPSDHVGPAPQYPIESVDNALKVLLLLDERPELRLTDVSEHLGVASSTAHRLLAMLLYRGFVRQDRATKAYLPGTALTRVAFSILERFDGRASLRPLLERLNAELRETVHLGVLVGADVQFIDAIESPQAVRVASRLGRAMPASSTSTGKALLAQLPDEQVVLLYPDEALVTLTPESVATRTELLRQLALVRARGYASSSEESETGVSSMAVALPTGNGPRLALNVALPTSRMSKTKEKRFAVALAAAADDATGILPGSGPTGPSGRREPRSAVP
jgi:DNA-binding IclR family transcriptional regulator